MTEQNLTPEEEKDLLKRMRAIASDLWRETEGVSAKPKPPAEKPQRVVVKQPDIGIDNLWMTADETIDWTDALGHEYPLAEAVLNGDLQAYAEVLKKANPLGELTGFANGISLRAPTADRVEALFHCLGEYMEKDEKKYLCAMGVRIARDLFACLPVSEVGVEARMNGKPVMHVTYHRDQLLHRNFTFLDPVNLTEECGAEFE